MLRSRFAQRAQIGARFVNAYLDDFSRRETRLVERSLTRDQLAEADFEHIVAGLQVDAAVFLDGQGRLVHVWPRNDALIGRDLTVKYVHLAVAHRGQRAVSQVVPSAAREEPVVAVAVPIRTRRGTAVFSGAFAASSTPIGSYVTNAVAIPGSRIFVLDAHGTVVASNVADANGVSLRVIDRDLAHSVTSRRAVFDGDQGRVYFAVTPVTGTAWRVIVSVPHRTLYSAVSGMSSLLPWLLLAGLAVISVIVVGLQFRLRRQRRRLATANRELETASEQVEDLARRQRALLARSSHELRTPLTSILGYLEEVLETPGAVIGETADHVRTAYRNAQRLHALVDDLLILDQVDTHQVDLHIEPVPVSAVLDPVVRDFEILCIRKGVRLVIPNPMPRLEILVDPQRTEQILANLLSNALKHTATNGTVTIACDTDDDRCCAISVADTGLGIPPDELSKVFDHFFRSRASTRAAIPGTGLGLPIARSLAEAQGGSITVTSVEGVGTTFTVTVPMVPALSAVV